MRTQNPQAILKRSLRTRLRELQILVLVSRGPLIAFLAIVLGGAFLIHRYYTYPGTVLHPDYSVSLFASFAMKMNVKHSFYVEDQLLVINELVVLEGSSL